MTDGKASSSYRQALGTMYHVPCVGSMLKIKPSSMQYTLVTTSCSVGLEGNHYLSCEHLHYRELRLVGVGSGGIS